MTISLHTSNQNNFQQQDKPTDFLTFRPLISAFPRVPSTFLEVEVEVIKCRSIFAITVTRTLHMTHPASGKHTAQEGKKVKITQPFFKSDQNALVSTSRLRICKEIFGS